MRDNSDYTVDISGIVEAIPNLDEISQDEVKPYNINLANVSGKARVGVTAPLGAKSKAVDYINEHVEDIVNKEMSTDEVINIGEMFIKGDGTIVDVQIEDKYKK
jgi:hypothetical protein